MKKTSPTKKVRKPKPTSDRKRPSKSFIMKMVEYRGYMTGNETTLLTGLEVKNALQRINNRGMSDNATIQFTPEQNGKLQAIMKDFVRGVNEVLK